ncbi:MAG: type IV pilus biogenesis/stability protein PilW, partial [Pseudohongiellaceae bacterium]
MITSTARLLMLLVSGVLLTACVTSSTSIFNTQVSEEQALQDYLQLSMGYLEQGELDSAKRHLNNAMEIEPNSSEVHAVWGLVYSRQGDTELADESFRRAIRLNGRNSQARNNYAAFLFANGRYQDAYDQLENVVTDVNYRSRPQAFENLGLAAVRLNRSEDAENAFNRALQLNANQLRSSLELANINLGKEDIQQARAYYNNFTSLAQRFNLGHSARSLLIGARLEKA